jgi:YHS domain-containing protein
MIRGEGHRLRPDPMKFLLLRVLLPLLVFLILRSVIRTLFAGSSAPPTKHGADPPPVPSGGELKKDPVCGTYVSATAGLSAKVGGEMVYFCSDDCRRRYRG